MNDNNDNKIYFSKIPNSLFYSYLDKKLKKEIKSIFPQIKDEKVLLVFDYLYTNTNRKGIINFTLENMVVQCGFKCSTKKGEMNDQFKNILNKLHISKIINSNIDFKDIKPKDFVSCTYLINLDNSFITLYDSEKNIVLNQSFEKCDNLKLLMYYCYLKARMYKRSNDDAMEKNGGRAEVAYPTYNTISDDLGLTDETIKKYNDLLVKLNLIRVGSAGNWYYKDDKNKILRESCNIYTLLIDSDEVKAKFNLKEGIKYYKSLDINSNKVFTNSKAYKNNDRKLNGELGSIIKKENKGTATEEDIARKNEIIASINADAELYKIKALLEANDGTLLSEIYENLGKDDLAKKYSNIELKLGLVDFEFNLEVDWDYYCYIITNYKENEHEKFKNYVRKHKRDNGLDSDLYENIEDLL
ncbi:hypothetical protein HMPREF1982_03533 [Clostridiales bacterium oral taxon 876 str. F0540]|nr:hypothetical protein HMPREF1982_03533 [Clostridiales bacterium oral taxon 876 str. F0540]